MNMKEIHKLCTHLAVYGGHETLGSEHKLVHHHVRAVFPCLNHTAAYIHTKFSIKSLE